MTSHFVSLLCSIMVTESSSWPRTGTTLMRCLWTDGVVDGVEMDRNWCVACDTHVLCLCVWMGVDGHEKDVTNNTISIVLCKWHSRMVCACLSAFLAGD